jgi:hypothetical protein
MRLSSYALPLCLGCAFFGSSLTLAQPAPTASVSVSASTTAPYQDRVIEGLPALEEEQNSRNTYNRQGLPRSFSIETYAEQRGVGTITQQQGLRLSGFQDTLYWGSFSGQLDWQQGTTSAPGMASRSNSKSSWLMTQRGMPLDGGWLLGNAVGNTQVPAPEMSRQGTRIGLPSASMLGWSTQAHQTQATGSLQLQAAWGRAGELEGFPVPSFRTTGGSYSYLSAQQNWQSALDHPNSLKTNWQFQTAFAQADLPEATNGNTLLRPDTRSLYAALRRESLTPAESGSWSLPGWQQINVLFNQASSLPANTATLANGLSANTSQGLWVDGGFRSGSHEHQWGLFYLEPQLLWLDGTVASDLKGGYWRHQWRTRQWGSESQLELLAPAQGNSPAGFFASQGVRYQYSSQTSFGANLNVRRYNANGQSLQLFSQWSSNWGSSRAQVELSGADAGDRLIRTQFDQDWPTFKDLRLSTSLSLDREKRQGVITHGWGFAASLDWALAGNLSLTNSLNSRSSGGQLQYTLNSGLNWQLAPQWSLNASVYAVQGNPQAGSVVQSPLNVAAATGSRLQDKGVMISLRYSLAAGSAQAPLGGRVGSAAGAIKGLVFLDDNGNGLREASERAAAQVSVVLNGRFTTQTDSQGRFEFPYVAAGSHSIEVISDNLPLPWQLTGDGKRRIIVSTRETTTVDVSATKP